MLFRNRHLVRVVASYLLLQTLSSVFVPLSALAGTGPNQPEFTSYNPGETDLVDLATGDFGYSIPLLEVPGPEQSFSLPLSYKSGIKLEQEASWVGLGWTLNAGAVSRTLNGYADDAAGDQVQTHFLKHVGAVEQATYVPGVWTTTTDLYTRKNVGQIDLLGLVGANWDNDGIAGGDIIGIGFQKGEFNIDAVRMVMGAATIATMGGAAAAGKATMGALLAKGFAQQVGIATAAGMMGLGKLAGTEGSGNQLSIYNFTTGSYAATFVPMASLFTDYHKEYTYSLYGKSTKENTYGSLYFNKLSQKAAPVTTQNRQRLVTSTGTTIAPVEFVNARLSKANLDDPEGPGSHVEETAADIYQPTNQTPTSAANPISMAHDYFSVMGGASSGLIRPYRLDVGSVAAASTHTRTVDADTKYMAVPFQDYKVGFRYEGDLSNTYEYHQNTDLKDSGFKISEDKRSVVMTDPRLFEAAQRTAPTRKGVVNGSTGPHFMQGKNVQWFSNAEIEQMGANQAASEFLDFAPPVANTVTANAFRHGLPPDGIGAFKITTEDGTTYHYSLPVYEFKTNTYSMEATDTHDLHSRPPGEYYKKQGIPTTANAHGGYATTWLLTAITSADYIDRNNSGTADAADWGGWVRLEYGKFSSQYKWRQPYIGKSYSDENRSVIEYENYMEGYRESYYLDRISTRTHTALFVKTQRVDGKGHFTPDYTAMHARGLTKEEQTHDMGIDEQFPASSLRLDEIILLDNATLGQLQSPANIPSSTPDNPTPVFTNNTANNAATSACGSCGDDFAGVLDEQDLATDKRIREFIEANAIKRVHFNYDYDLCQGTPNSFTYTPGQIGSLPPMSEGLASTNRSGKLTLKSVSFFGPTVAGNPTKIIPDFVFGYDAPGVACGLTNPFYQKDKWDAYGMYTSSGQYNVASHSPTTQGYVAPWTLTSITSPLGGETRITYERDDYSHISELENSVLWGYITKGSDQSLNVLTVSQDALNGLGMRLKDMVHLRDGLKLTGYVAYTYSKKVNNADGTTSSAIIYKRDDFAEQIDVTAVTDNTITLSKDYMPEPALYEADVNGAPVISDARYTASIAINRPGGDVRVAAITTTDPESSASYEVRYKYTTGSSDARGNSTGVIAQTVPFTTWPGPPNPGHESYDYPQTPVLYSQVSVLHGPFKNDSDANFDSKQVFEFYTPATSMYTQDLQFNAYGNFWNEASRQYDGEVRLANNQIKINTGLIGRPKAVRSYNQLGQLELSSEMLYANQIDNLDHIARQGYYTEGLLSNHMLNSSEYNINRTTKVYEPSVLVGTKTMRNGVMAQRRNLLFDFFTGQTLETATTASTGKVYHTRTVPAYTLPGQEGMGPKALASGNHNMLVQPGASYSFVEIPGGKAYTPYDPFNTLSTRVLSANVQTWQSNWSNYREPNSSGAYQDVAGQVPVWRPAATYVWQSPAVASDGSLKDFVPFAWTGLVDAHWLKTSEVVRADHYSHIVEMRDLNKAYTTNKMGYDQTLLLASATNARYTELAYSGAEDQVMVNGSPHFGGEVIAGGIADKTIAHTGFYSTKLAANASQSGFLYRAQADRDIDVGKTYRVSAWVHENAPGGKLYAAYNGIRIAEVARSSANTKKAGAWYLLNLLVKIPVEAKGQIVEFGCLNEGASPGNFDDFRVAPLVSAVTSKVYDPHTNRVLYSLDNDNLFTHYEYTPTGRLQRVYQETLDGTGGNAPEKLVKEFSFNFARLRFPTWVTTAYRCVLDANGNYTGNQERQITDVNPLNNPPTPSRWVSSNCIANPYLCCPPAGTILGTWCSPEEEQDGHMVYRFYNIVADGKCGTYTDQIGFGNSGCY